MRIYLDACCLNRPYDDLRQPRIRLEAEAVTKILQVLDQRSAWVWVSSEVLQYEIGRTPDPERRARLQLLERRTSEVVRLEESVISRALQLEMAGLGSYDALHLASAEAAGCDVFLSTDDRLVKIASRAGIVSDLKVVNPLEWLKEGAL